MGHAERVDPVRRHRVVLAQHLPHHLPAERDRHRRGTVRDLAPERTGRRQQLLRRMQRAHQPAFERLFGGEDAARRDPLHRLLHAHQARQEPGGRRLHHHAAPREDEAEPRFRGGEADVHRQDLRDTEADRRAVHRRDHRLLHVEEAERHEAAAVPVARARLRRSAVEGARTARKVGPGAEGAARSGDDDRAHAVVAVGRVQRRHILVDHGHVDGVQPVRPVERERQQAVLDLGPERLIRQMRIPPKRHAPSPTAFPLRVEPPPPSPGRRPGEGGAVFGYIAEVRP